MRLEGLCPEQAARLLAAVEIPLSVNMALDTHSMRWQSSRLLGPGVYFAWCDSSQAASRYSPAFAGHVLMLAIHQEHLRQTESQPVF